MSATDVIHSLDGLAPAFHKAVTAALAECRATGYDAVVFESLRTMERQAWLYAEGRTRPGSIVTNARDARYGWHFYGLAVDVISASHKWDLPEGWWRSVGQIFERHGSDWGGRWKMHDTPHMQWGRLKPTPSDTARFLYASGGLPAVWKAVGADDIAVPAIQPTVVARPIPLDTVPDFRAPIPAPVDSLTAEAVMADSNGGLKQIVKDALHEALTEENTDKVLDYLAHAAETVLPDVPVEIAEKILDALLPEKLIEAIDLALT